MRPHRLAGLALLPLLASCLGENALPEFRLPVSYHHQEHSLSCEAAALKMVFDYYGVGMTETEILAEMPFDHTPHKQGTWGDPDQAFVGDVDGKMGVTGYGIHSRGLQRLSSRWKKTLIIENGKLEDVIAQLQARRPVIVWGYDEGPESLDWQTKMGRKIHALQGEHTRVVYGFRGDPASPTGLLLMDPESGPIVWSASKFLENWSALGRTGIVVLKDSS